MAHSLQKWRTHIFAMRHWRMQDSSQNYPCTGMAASAVAIVVDKLSSTYMYTDKFMYMYMYVY